MADFEIDDTVDITDVVCPTTFVKAKVALEELDDGQILAVRMNVSAFCIGLYIFRCSIKGSA